MTRGSQKFTSFFFISHFVFPTPSSLFHPSIHPFFLRLLGTLCMWLWDRSTVLCVTDTNCYSLYTGIKIQVKKTGKGKKLSYEVICCSCVFFPPYFPMIMTLSAWIMHSRVCPPLFLTAMSFFMPLQKHNVLPPSPHFPLLQERYSLRCSWTFLCYILTSGSEYW